MAGPVRRVTGNPNHREFTMYSATPSVAVGDLVKWDANGLIVIATDGVVGGIMRSKDPSSTTTNVIVDVIVDDDSLFSICSNTTPTVALTGDAAAITFTTTALYATAGTGELVIQGLDPLTATASGSRILVKFLPSELQACTPALT
jgi:hypothetical protein